VSSFYIFEGGLYHPQAPATAPWTRRHQNGVSISGLLAREIERVPAAGQFQLARLTVEMQRGVPLAPSSVRTTVVRDGKRIQLVEAELLVDGEAYASALGLRTLTGESPYEAPQASGLPLPDDAPRDAPVTRVLGEGHPMQTRIVRGARRELGPAAYWTLFNADLVAGEQASPTVRAVMSCDIASTVSDVVGSEWECPNVDLSIYLARPAQGDWFLTDAQTEQFGTGYGIVSSTLSDTVGPIGYAHQTLLYTHAEEVGNRTAWRR